MTQPLLRLIATIFLALSATSPASADKFKSPDILILGDSQITFGAGPAYRNFFKNLNRTCRPKGQDRARIKRLSRNSVAVIGVRSTSLKDWTATTKQGKTDICDIDPKLKLNAGAYGTVNRERAKYVQIGVGQDFQFCKPSTSPLNAALQPDYYKPKLLVLSFLGNTTKRWAASQKAANADVQLLAKQLPQDVACVFMTTAPTFKETENAKRLPSQAAIQRAFAKHAPHCAFVNGITPKSIAALTNNKHNFRINDLGKVKDPFHPTHLGATVFLQSIQPELCTAISQSLK